MKNILIIGATGQIGSELTMKLRSLYPEGNVVAGYIPGAEPKGALLESGPSHIVDITNPAQIAEAVDKYKVDTIYNLAALLSAVAEARPQLAWKIGVGGLYNTPSDHVGTESASGIFYRISVCAKAAVLGISRKGRTSAMRKKRKIHTSDRADSAAKAGRGKAEGGIQKWA